MCAVRFCLDYSSEDGARGGCSVGTLSRVRFRLKSVIVYSWVMRTSDLETISAARVPVIETRDGGRTYRAHIWVSVDDGEFFIRSVRGESGRWYQRALRDPKVALHSGDARVEFRAVPLADDASIERASAGFRRKYASQARWQLKPMLRSKALPATLRLDPI